MESEYCLLCGRSATQRHHMIRRSKCKPLIKCEMNIAPLCTECHYKLHFMAGGKELEIKLQEVFLNKLELLLLKREFAKEEIQDLLQINSKSTDSLCKTMKSQKGMFNRNEIIKACTGRIITEGEGQN